MSAVATIPNTPIATVEQSNRSPSTWLTPSSFEAAMRIAELMAKCGTMPGHLVGKPADCFRIVVQAAKWQMDPFAVGECTSLVHGKMCYEGKLVHAALLAMGVLSEPLEYTYNDEKGDALEITVTGTMRRGGKSKSIKGTVGQWKTQNEGWKNDPYMRLAYRGNRVWARLHAPDALLGVYTPDEMEEVREVQATVIPDPTPAKEREAPAAEAPPADATPAKERVDVWAKRLYAEHKAAALAELKALNATLGIKTLSECPADKVAEAEKALAEIQARLEYSAVKKGA